MPVDRRGGIDTHWMRFGQGARQALLLHCSLGHSGGWSGMARLLAEDLDMLAFDLPGHGRSADWDGVTDLQTQAMAQAADFLSPAAPMDLIGHSFGGTVALRLAVERPELVRSLVLIEPVFFAVAMADRPDLKARHETEMGAYYAAMEAGDMVQAARVFTGFWGDGRGWDSLPPAQREAMAARIHLVKAGGAQIYGDAAGLMAPGRLQSVRQSVLLIEGGASPVYIAAINDGLMRRLPRARRAVVAGAGHMAPITHPAEVAALARDHLAAHPA